MRIDDSFAASTDLRSLQVDRTPEAQLEQQSRAQRTERGGDAVDLSALSTDIARALAEDSPQEIARVDRAQEAVAAGNFSVPAAEVADSLIDSALTEGQLNQGQSAQQVGAPSSPI